MRMPASGRQRESMNDRVGKEPAHSISQNQRTTSRRFSKAQNRGERRFQATKRDVAKALLPLRRTIAAFKQAQETSEDGVAVLDREVGLKRLDYALPIIGAVAEV